MPTIATFFNHIEEIAAQNDMSIPEALQEARALGVTRLELFTTSAADPGPISRQLSAAGMTVASMPVWFDFGNDADVEAQAAPAFRAVKDMGAERLLIIPGFLSGGAEQRERQRAQMLACTARLGELADKEGVALCMEDFDSHDVPYATSAGMLDFIAACPGLSACYDTGNFRVAAEDELAAYDALRGHIGHVHLKDRAFSPTYGQDAVTAADGVALYPCPVGHGGIRIAEALELLKADGYAGSYAIEHFGAADMLGCLKMSTEWVKSHIS